MDRRAELLQDAENCVYLAQIGTVLDRKYRNIISLKIHLLVCKQNEAIIRFLREILRHLLSPHP